MLQFDSKKSPLALLAQTCSQIGADSSSTKPLITSAEKKKPVNSVSDSVNRISPNNSIQKEKPRSSPDNKHLAFKPYEVNVVTKKPEEARPSSKASTDSSEDKKSGKSSPGRKSTPPGNFENGKSSPSSEKKSSPGSSSGTSPIIRSGLEVLGHGKDHLAAFKNLPGLPGFPLAGLCYPPGMEQHANPAFRPPYAGAPFNAHHAAMIAAAAGFPGSSHNPYLGYARVKTQTGGETLVPVCKDPYCTGCQFSANNHHLLMSNGSCPAGCTQCEHQKYSIAMAMALSQQGVAAASSNLSYAQMNRPYVCNWIVGESYCGKRFGNSEELLQHLRSHTADGTVTSTATSQPSMLNPLSPLFSTAGLRSAYPSAPLSPLSANRFHPYSKGIPAGMTASPYGAFNPALGPFYAPYAMYGQRLGAAAVHQ